MAYNTILLQVNSLAEKYGEAEAAGTITPGDLIEFQHQGKVQRHSGANLFGEQIVAIENSFEGKLVSNDYAAGEKVRFFRLQIGDKAALNLTTSQTIVVNDHLSSNGAGKLQKTTGTNIALFKSAEAATVTTTGTGTLVAVRTIHGGVPIAQTTTTSGP